MYSQSTAGIEFFKDEKEVPRNGDETRKRGLTIKMKKHICSSEKRVLCHLCQCQFEGIEKNTVSFACSVAEF